MRLAVMQQRLAKSYEAVMPLKTAPLPFEIPPMRVMAQSHSARASDQGLRWLLTEVHTAADNIFDAETDAR
jgi:hypothetical protein